MSANFQSTPPEPVGWAMPAHEVLSSRSFTAPVFHATRRPYERITLSEKVLGGFGADKVVLLDVSLSGVQIAHETERRVGDRATLTFEWRGEAVVIECEVMRAEIYRPATRAGHAIWRSGLAFRRHIGSSQSVLRTMVTELVERALDERRSNANGVPPRVVSSTQRGGHRGYLRFRLVQNVWQRIETADAMQPRDGFTVSIEERPDQIKVLCETYEKLSENDRDLVRRMASLTTESPDGTPARRYEP